MQVPSTSFIIIKMKIKISVSYHYMPIRIAKIKIVTTANAGESVENLNHLYIHCW